MSKPNTAARPPSLEKNKKASATSSREMRKNHKYGEGSKRLSEAPQYTPQTPYSTKKDGGSVYGSSVYGGIGKLAADSVYGSSKEKNPPKEKKPITQQESREAAKKARIRAKKQAAEAAAIAIAEKN